MCYRTNSLGSLVTREDYQQVVAVVFLVSSISQHVENGRDGFILEIKLGNEDGGYTVHFDLFRNHNVTEDTTLINIFCLNEISMALPLILDRSLLTTSIVHCRDNHCTGNVV